MGGYLKVCVDVACVALAVVFAGCRRTEGLTCCEGRDMAALSQESEAPSVPAAGLAGSDATKLIAALRRKLAVATDDELLVVLRGLAPPGEVGEVSNATWFGKRLEQASQQRDAARMVKSLGGGLFYDYQKGSGICRPEGQPRAPAWLRDIVGDLFFVDVVGVALSGEEVTDDVLDRLRAFPNIDFLMLNSTAVDEKGLATLTTFPRLTYLEIRDTRIPETVADELAKRLPRGCAVDFNWKLIQR